MSVGLGSVYEKSLRDRGRSMLWWAIGLVAMVAISVAFWPSVRDLAGGFKAFIERLPDTIKGLFGGALDFTTPVGYLNARLFALVAPVMLLIVTVGFGSRGIAGEEERGTLDLLLSTPIHRRRVVGGTFGGMLTEVGVLAAVLWLAVVVLSPLVDLDVGSLDVAVATVSVALLALCFGSAALAVGAATGRPGLASGAATGLAVTMFVVNGLGATVDALKPLRPLTPWYHAVTVDPLKNGLGAANLAYLVLVPLALFAFSVWTFDRRDLGT